MFRSTLFQSQLYIYKKFRIIIYKILKSYILKIDENTKCTITAKLIQTVHDLNLMEGLLLV